MSATYAERLSEYPDKGKCGLPENFDSKRALLIKIDQLAQLMKQSRYTVVLTGAGISTSAGIPDFRGPNGIWTKEQERKKRKKAANGKKRKKIGRNSIARSESSSSNDDERGNSISFETAIPTFTHRSLTHLLLQPPLSPSTEKYETTDESNSNDNNNETENGANTTTKTNASTKRNKSNGDSNKKKRIYLHHIVTQNIDGLHNKTKIPRQNISILHGDIFTEKCDTCQREYVRPHEIDSIGLKHTGRHCTLGGNPPGTCPGRLKDTLLDWEDALPDEDWGRAQEECAKADLILCLGTSLRIEPAAGLCELAMVGAESTLDDQDDDGDVGEGGRFEVQEEDNTEQITVRKRRKVENLRSKPKRRKLGYVIVNLQVTPYDDDAALVIRGKVDDVMKELMKKLGYQSNWDDLHDYGKSGAIHSSEAVEVVRDGSERDELVDISGNIGDRESANAGNDRESDISANPLGGNDAARKVNGQNERPMCGGRSNGLPEVLVIDDESESDVSVVGDVRETVAGR